MLNDNAPSWLFADPYAYQYSDLSSHVSKAQSNENMPGSSAATVRSRARRTSYHHAAAGPTRDASQAPELHIPPAPREQWSSLESVMPRSPYHHMRAMDYNGKMQHAADPSVRHSTLEVVAAPVTPSKSKSALNFDDILQGVEREKTKLGFKTWEIERARGRRARARFDAGN